MNIVDIFINASNVYYNGIIHSSNTRYRSWEYCYYNFSNFKNKNIDYDYLSLHLAFYLASWGMYRGSSFLLHKDYKIHIPAVEIILQDKYSYLSGISCLEYKDSKNINLLMELATKLANYYDNIRRNVKDNDIKNQISDTLITKILMGTLGCVPAYDRFFVASIKKYNIAPSHFNEKSVIELAEFYEQNFELLEAVRKKMLVDNVPYPQMKLLDMGFWQIGYGLADHKNTPLEEAE